MPPLLPNRLGGEVQRLALPGGGELFTAPAVWATPTSHRGTSTTVFVGAEHATAAYALIGGPVAPGVGEQQSRDEPGDGRRTALRL